MLKSKKIQGWICILSAVLLSAAILGTIYVSALQVHTDDGKYYYSIYSMKDILPDQSFENSDLFKQIVLDTAKDQNDYLQAKELFDSAADETTIDLGYYNMQINGGEATGIRYYLNDLIQWRQSYELEFIDVSADSFKRISRIKEVEPHAEIESSTYDDDGDGTYYYLINDEYFLTQDGRSLYTCTDSAVTMEMYTLYLQDTINYIQTLYNAYQKGPAEDASNMTVKLVNTTDSAVVSKAEQETVLASKYLIYRKANRSLLTNITGMEKWMMQYYLNLQSGQNVYITVDTSYPVKDLFTTVGDFYNSMKQVFMKLFPLDFLLAALFLFSFIRRTVLEGRAVQGTEARPRKIADWKNALCIAVPVFIVILAVTIIAGIIEEMWWYDFSNKTIFMFTSVVIVTAVSLVMPTFLYFFEELVLRLKKKNFYAKSFLKVIVDSVKRLLSFVRASVKWCLCYLLFLMGNVILLVAAADPMIVLLTLIADLVIGAYFLRHFVELARLQKQMKKISTGEGTPDIQADHYHGTNHRTAELLQEMNLGITRAVNVSLKDERMKTELITNVSHDIKTPLTSIINYVDLLKKEDITSENAQKYIGILDQKSMRLKQLIDDLMEASKITSGNIEVQKMTLEAGELLRQTAAEYSDKLSAKGLELVMSLPEAPVYFQADSRHIWRVLSNLFSNAAKYAMPGTRVYMNVYGGSAVTGDRYTTDAEQASQPVTTTVRIEMKNISESPLNISPEELTERFVRGDESRTLEGNGLGLSIARSLMETMGGSMEIVIDGDLFKVVLVF